MLKKDNLPGFKSIELERSICFGNCPVYKLLIHSNGTVEYWGYYFVKQEGHHTWKIDPAVIEKLNLLISKNGYFSMKKKEPEFLMTDMPSCITKIVLENGRSRKINHDYGEDCYPETLEKMENDIEELSNVKKYINEVI